MNRDNVHEIFDAPLQAMAGDQERPLQPHQPAYDTSIPFNEYDDGMMHDVVGNKRLAKPVQALLELLHTIEATSGSFGVDDEKAMEQVIPALRDLREACKAEWEDQ